MKLFNNKGKHFFLIKNIFQGFLWLIVIVTAFSLLNSYVRGTFEVYIAELYTSQTLFYGLFTISEIVFGVIPPEFFMMIYILHKIPLFQFVINLFVLTSISYTAGVLDYFVGRQFYNVKFIKKINDKYLSQYEIQLKRYGKYFLIAGAITPIPFSAVCMLMGITRFPVRSFLLASMFRIFRFMVYGWIMWSIPTAFNGG